LKQNKTKEEYQQSKTLVYHQFIVEKRLRRHTQKVDQCI